MPDLTDQIRTYYEATTEPVDVDAVVVDSGTVLVGPFPDAAQRRAMKTAPEQSASSRRRVRPRWRGPVVAVGVFVAVVALGVSLVAVGLRSDDGAPGAAPIATTDVGQATQPPATTTGSTAAPPTTGGAPLSVEEQFVADVEKIESMLRAWNDGDLDLVRSLLTERPVIFGSESSSDDAWDGARALMVANERWELVGPCTDLAGLNISCPIVRSDDLTQAAGVSPEVMDATFRVIEGGLVSSFDVSGGDQIPVFLEAFDEWLLTAYPEVHSGFGERPFSRLPNAEDMPVALQYVEEFVAQSDVYPL